MNLDDIDFEEEWEAFKRIVGSNLFVIGPTLGSVNIYFDDQCGHAVIGDPKCKIVDKVFKIWKELDLVNICSNQRNCARYRIKELCSMSNPSIQSNEK